MKFTNRMAALDDLVEIFDIKNVENFLGLTHDLIHIENFFQNNLL